MQKEFGFWFWIHVILLIFAYLSPFLFNWQLIVAGVIILQIQFWLIGGCAVTYLQMGRDKDQVFIWYYLQKIYPDLNPKLTKILIRVVVPCILVSIGYLMQVVLKINPIFNFLN